MIVNQKIFKDLRRKVARVLGSKCTLAARVDSFHESGDGQIGQQFREEIEKKMEKFQVSSIPSDQEHFLLCAGSLLISGTNAIIFLIFAHFSVIKLAFLHE
jgi:hypothetical protein